MSTNATSTMFTFAVVVILVLLAKEMTLVETAAVCPGDMIYDDLKTECICPRNMYYDMVTRRCTDCYDICSNAALKRTKDECHSLCPYYQLPLNDMPASVEGEEAAAKTECPGDMHYDKVKMKCVCPKDMFYDEVTRHCSNCYAICYHAAIQGTEEECNAACPGYHLPITTTVSPISTPSSGPDYHKVVVIVSICSSVGLLITVIVSVVCCCRARGKGKGRCSLVVSCLSCVRPPADGNGAEAENDRHHEIVQLAVTGRPSEAFDCQQPHDPETNTLLTPSCHTANNVDEVTRL